MLTKIYLKSLYLMQSYHPSTIIKCTVIPMNNPMRLLTYKDDYNHFCKMSLRYDIVKANSGEIKVETKEGEGSIFRISIPCL